MYGAGHAGSTANMAPMVGVFTTDPQEQLMAPAPDISSVASFRISATRSIVTGPLISGELRAAKEATVRAELGGSMLQVAAEEGQMVRRGAVIGRIETTTLEDARRSAESAVKSAESQLAVARREAERTEQLVKAGALAQRDLEVAQSNVTAAEAQLADARSRLVAAGKQLGDTILRAPFDGVVADRAVNVGDVVTPGTALFTIITANNAAQHGMSPEDLQVYSVESDKVGIMTTLDGKPISEGEIAGLYLDGHDNFQNAQAFINNGGQRGLQEQILLSGSWNLNPWFARVEQVPMTEIPIGYVGVVISFPCSRRITSTAPRRRPAKVIRRPSA